MVYHTRRTGIGKPTSPIRRSKKPIAGQIDLLGGIYNLNLKYQPRIITSPTGEKVVVLRIPASASQIDRVASHQEANRLAGTVETSPNKDYWAKKARDNIRRKALLELSN